MLRHSESDPAERWVVLDDERWEEELAIDELRTHQRDRPVLRSQTPRGVIPEWYGRLLGHGVVRGLMQETAKRKTIGWQGWYLSRPVSFTHALF